MDPGIPCMVTVIKNLYTRADDFVSDQAMLPRLIGILLLFVLSVGCASTGALAPVSETSLGSQDLSDNATVEIVASD